MNSYCIMMPTSPGWGIVQSIHASEAEAQAALTEGTELGLSEENVAIGDILQLGHE